MKRWIHDDVEATRQSPDITYHNDIVMVGLLHSDNSGIIVSERSCNNCLWSWQHSCIYRLTPLGVSGLYKDQTWRPDYVN